MKAGGGGPRGRGKTPGHARPGRRGKRPQRDLERLEEELGRTKQQLSMLLDSLPVIPYTCEAEEPFAAIHVANTVIAVTGYHPEEFTSKAPFWADHIHPEDKPAVFANLPRLFQKGHHEHEYRFRIKDGSYRWFRDVLRLVRGPQGRVNHIAGAWFDITQEKEAEEKIRQAKTAPEQRVVGPTLQEHEPKFRHLMDSVPDAIVVVSREGCILDANNQAETLFGYALKELFGRPVEVLLPERFQEKHVRHRQTYLVEPHTRPMGSGLELYGRRKDGSEFPVDISLSCLETESGPLIASIIRDISERKQVEEGLKQRTIYLNALMEANPLAIVVLDQQHRVQNCNTAFEQLFLYRRSEIVEASLDELIAPPDAGRKLVQYTERVLAGERIHFCASRQRKDGTFAEVEVYGVPLIVHGRLSGAFGIYQDITERKQVEETLRKSEARLAEAQRIAQLGSWEWDIVRDKALWSDETCRMFGLKPTEFGGTYEAFLNSVHPDDRDFVMKTMDAALQEGKPYSFEHRIVLPSGSERIVHEQAEITRDNAGRPIRMAGTVLDVTERNRAEKELRSSHRQLRRLAAHLQSIREEERTTIAREMHDELGQALTSMQMDITWIEQHLGKQHKDLQKKARSSLKLVDSAIQSVRDLSMRLRPGLLDDLGVAAAIEWQAQDFQARTGIQCRLELPVQPLTLPSPTSTAIFRIFQEALTNVARHAKASQAWIRIVTLQDGLSLEVTDNGRGIGDDEIGDARSLGILGMQERAYAIGAELTVGSCPGEGTTVKLRIPVLNANSDVTHR